MTPAGRRYHSGVPACCPGCCRWLALDLCWPELPTTIAGHPCSAAWPLLRPNRCAWHLECKAAKKSSRSTTALGQQPTSAFSPSTHCPTCLLPSHRHHVRRTATQPEGRVEGMPSHDRARRLGDRLANCRVYRGGVRRCGSTSAPARVSKMSSNRTWARWAPSRCMSAFCASCGGGIG